MAGVEEAAVPAGSSGGADGGGMVSNFMSELITSPLNLALLGLCGYLLYKIVSSRRQENNPSMAREPDLPPMKKRDFTLAQLREYDGRTEDGRILIAVNQKVFDVTRGKKFYGPGQYIGLSYVQFCCSFYRFTFNFS